MKKLFFVMAITFCAIHSQAQTDTAKINNQIKKLNLKLADLNSELVDTRTQIPVDSLKLENALAKSHDAQVKSKKMSGQAVGGDADDAKQAEKQAKKASKETGGAEDASKQLERRRKKAKSLEKQIDKAQKDLAKLQTPGS